jgi:hypothetical protein
MFSIGVDPYRNLNLAPDLSEQQRRLVLALRGSRATISDIGRVEPRGWPADRETLRAYRETDDLVRKTSLDVDRRKNDLGAARYIRWGNFCLSWLELRDELPLVNKAPGLSVRIATGRQYAVACAEEIARLPAAIPAPSPEQKKSGSETATGGGWKRFALAGAVTAGVVLLLRRVFGVGENG